MSKGLLYGALCLYSKMLVDRLTRIIDSLSRINKIDIS
ncbi:hypothetical protein FUAX_25850 [Fulvitalea axinellae]|uniref:Uncharacterized protein n=1 Tax=Fulvitalea axinellae TaxID=1182444 RepID=A0AAU9CJ74_9BACT|nr:hypothetical protein FUAX_25850 [Fulvitalea axinellae]